MSFDLAVFFNTTESPKETVLPLLHEFGETGPRDDKGHWFLAIDDSSLHFRINEIKGPNQHGHSLGFKWCLYAYANSGCTPTTRWAQFSVLYRCLAFLPDTAAFDPQSEQIFKSTEQYLNFPSRCITRWPGLASKLRKLGLMDENEKLVLDRPTK